jgi:hypothetical protein
MMFPKYIIKSSIDGGESFQNYAYCFSIEEAIDSLAYLLKYYPDEKYQLYESILTRIT